MQRQGTMWYCLAVLAVLASCGLDVFAGADADKKEDPEPLPREIVKAWRGIGANVGWMKMDLGDNRPTFQVEGEIRGMTVFQFYRVERRRAGEDARSWGSVRPVS